MRTVALVLLLSAGALAWGDVLWNQPPSTTYGAAWVQWEFTDQPARSTYTVNDFQVPAGPGWTLDSVTKYFMYTTTPVTQARLNIWSKTASMPDDATMDPTTGSLVDVTFTFNASLGKEELTATGLNLTLAPGDYWITLTPLSNYAQYGQTLMAQNTTTILLDDSRYRNPGGGCGYAQGTVWINSYANSYYNWEDAMKIQGTLAPEPGALSLLALAGLALIRRR